MLPLIGVNGASETLLMNQPGKANAGTRIIIRPYEYIRSFLRLFLTEELSRQLALQEDDCMELVEALISNQIPILTAQLTVICHNITANGCLTKEVIEYLKQFACDLVKCLKEILSGDID